MSEKKVNFLNFVKAIVFHNINQSTATVTLESNFVIWLILNFFILFILTQKPGLQRFFIISRMNSFYDDYYSNNMY